MRITKAAIKNLTPTVNDQWLWDGELPGFGVRLNPHGRKTYVIRYRDRIGKQHQKKIARCCDMHPEQARELARTYFLQIANGVEPGREKTKPTMEGLWHRYLNEHATPFKKPRSVERDKSLWTLHIKPELGGLQVEAVTRSDIVSFHARLHNKPIIANRCLMLLSKMFNLADMWEWIRPGTNPARRVKKYREQIRERILSTDEIKRLLQVIDEPGNNPYMSLLVKLLLLTGCRLSEIRDTPTEWVDLERRIIVLPDSKTGRRVIELSDAAFKLVENCKSRQWLIPGRFKHANATQVWPWWRRVRIKAGLPDVRIHDLRHTVASHLHRAGVSQREIALMLGHKQLSTTERYIQGISNRNNRALAIAQNIMLNPAHPLTRVLTDGTRNVDQSNY